MILAQFPAFVKRFKKEFGTLFHPISKGGALGRFRPVECAPHFRLLFSLLCFARNRKPPYFIGVFRQSAQKGEGNITILTKMKTGLAIPAFLMI